MGFRNQAEVTLARLLRTTQRGARLQIALRLCAFTFGRSCQNLLKKISHEFYGLQQPARVTCDHLCNP